jgi:hypothetical protein
MKKFIVQNIQIFMTWLVYIVFRKRISVEALELADSKLKEGTREKKMVARVKKINQNK